MLLRIMGVLLSLFLTLWQGVIADEPPAIPPTKLLTIGDTAPRLDIDHWFHDNKYRSDLDAGFAGGRVYVIEFWGTHCPPCVASMPHLSELQRKYHDKMLLISISDEAVDIIHEFLKRNVPGEAQTYDDVTCAYALTTDPDRSVYQRYMIAAGMNAIPFAFIIGKTGLIEWAGHPSEMDDPLDAVIQDDWDRTAYAKNFKTRQELWATIRTGYDLLRANELDSILTLTSEALGKHSGNDTIELQLLRGLRFRALAEQMHFGDIQQELSSALNATGTELQSVLTLATTILQLPKEAELDRVALVDLAIVKIEAAMNSSVTQSMRGTKAMVRLTIAQLHLSAGQTEKALSELNMAAKDATADTTTRKQIQQMLNRIRKLK